MKQYLDLIKAMPVQEQAFTIKKKNWNRYIKNAENVAHSIEEIFDREETVKISRADLFDYAKNHDLEYFIIATIMWGYTKGMRGTHFENITNKENFESLKIALTKAKDGIDNWNEHYKDVKNITGLGLSTYSKFLYFIAPHIENNPPLILDLRIIAVIKNDNFNIFADLKKKLTYTNAPKYYQTYLKKMKELSSTLDVEPANLEMFLFMFGTNLKAKNQ